MGTRNELFVFPKYITMRSLRSSSRSMSISMESITATVPEKQSEHEMFSDNSDIAGMVGVPQGPTQSQSVGSVEGIVSPVVATVPTLESVPAGKSQNSRHYVFTHPQPPGGEHDPTGGVALYDWSNVLGGHVKYVVWQTERGGQHGLIHHQGYLELDVPRRFVALKAALPNGNAIRFDVRKATATAARNYCMKEETRVNGPWEHGTFVDYAAPKVRGEVLAEKARDYIINDGRDAEWIMEHDPKCYAACRGLITDLYRVRLARTPRKHRTNAFVILGHEGLGKTHLVRAVTEAEKFPQKFFKKTGDSKFYCGITEQTENLCFEDLKPRQLCAGDFNNFADRGVQTINVKGSAMPFRAYRLFITSNAPLNVLFPDLSEVDRNSMTRRIDAQIIMKRGYGLIEGLTWVKIAVQDVENDLLIVRPSGFYEGVMLPPKATMDSVFETHAHLNRHRETLEAFINQTAELLRLVLVHSDSRENERIQELFDQYAEHRTDPVNSWIGTFSDDPRIYEVGNGQKKRRGLVL